MVHTILPPNKFRNVQLNIHVRPRRTTSNVRFASNPPAQICVMAAVIYHPSTLETKHVVNGVKH